LYEGFDADAITVGDVCSLLLHVMLCAVGVFASAAAEFVEEVFSADLNEVYDTLIDVSPRQAGTKVTFVVGLCSN